MSREVEVRSAGRGDAYALWLWANDEETRRASHGREPISWAAHVRWLEARLDDPMALVLIDSVEDGQPIGSVRFDTSDAWETARLSYVVAAEARGQGFGRPLVQAGASRLRELRPRTRIFADVLDENVRSSRVFRTLGWSESSQSNGALRFWSVPAERGESGDGHHQRT